MVRQCPACGLESPAERSRCYNCNASLEREPVRASRNSEAPTEKRPRPATNLWSPEFNAPSKAPEGAPDPGAPEDGAVQLQRPTKGLHRGPMAADADTFQPAKPQRAGRGSSGDPSEIAPTRARGELGSGAYRTRSEPGTGQFRTKPPEPGTGQYRMGSGRPTPPAMPRERHSPWDPLRPPAPPPPPPPEGPLLEPKPRLTQVLNAASLAAEATDGAPAPARPVDEEAAKACAAANEAAKARKRFAPEDVAEFAEALDDFGEGSVTPSAGPAAAPTAPMPASTTPTARPPGPRPAPPPPPPGAPHYLVTQVLGEPVPLSPTAAFRIGRSEENEIVFPLTQVSRVHAEVRWDGAAGAYVIIDRNSVNGTYVNGKPVKRRRLVDGDRIAIGPFTIVYRVASGSVKARANDETDVIQTGALAGELAEMPIGDVVRFIEALRKTGELTVVTAAGDRGTLTFRDGQPVHAEWRVQLGAQAAVTLLRAKAGTFRFAAKPVEVQKATIAAPLAALLAEAGAEKG